ncbi:hypothetical protein GBF38_011462, partial [Nibea albiflora]
ICPPHILHLPLLSHAACCATAPCPTLEAVTVCRFSSSSSSSVSCIAFCLVILLLVVVFYRKEPLCCRFRPHRIEHYTDDSPHYHSRHSLIGRARNEHSAAMNQGAVGPQLPGRLFIIGKPNDYHLSEALPRLPSYESVRKKDRQRQIHSLISQRFGLSGYNEEVSGQTEADPAWSSSFQVVSPTTCVKPLLHFTLTPSSQLLMSVGCRTGVRR